MVCSTKTFTDLLRDRETNAERNYRDVVVDFASGKRVAPGTVEAAMFAARKTIDDFERDVRYCQDRVRWLAENEKLDKIASQGDPAIEIEVARDEKIRILKEIEVRLIAIEAEKRLLLEPVKAIDAKVAELRLRVPQIGAAKDRMRAIGESLKNSAPHWFQQADEALCEQLAVVCPQVQELQRNVRFLKDEILEWQTPPQGDRKYDYPKLQADRIARLDDLESELTAAESKERDLVQDREHLHSLAFDVWPLACDLEREYTPQADNAADSSAQLEGV